jgi:hypothetical protein
MNAKNLNKFCQFHHDHSYDTEEFHALKKDKKIDRQRLPLIVYKKRSAIQTNTKRSL